MSDSVMSVGSGTRVNCMKSIERSVIDVRVLWFRPLPQRPFVLLRRASLVL